MRGVAEKREGDGAEGKGQMKRQAERREFTMLR